jgi:hypothetical protein
MIPPFHPYNLYDIESSIYVTSTADYDYIDEEAVAS